MLQYRLSAKAAKGFQLELQTAVRELDEKVVVLEQPCVATASNIALAQRIVNVKFGSVDAEGRKTFSITLSFAHFVLQI